MLPITSLSLCLALQCIVNINVCISKLLHSQVVQASTLNVGCILESWLVSKGFAVCLSSNTTAYPEKLSSNMQHVSKSKYRPRCMPMNRLQSLHMLSSRGRTFYMILPLAYTLSAEGVALSYGTAATATGLGTLG